MKILNAKNISTLSIKVTEQIDKKHLVQFLRTNILHSQHFFAKNSYFYYHYNVFSSTYEVIIYEKRSSEIIPEPFILNKDNPNKKETTVYVTPSYFVLFDKGELLFFKSMTTPNKNDIVLYIQQIYKFDQFDLVELSLEELKKLKEKEYTMSLNHEISLYEDNSFKVFASFLFFSLILFGSLLVYTHINKQNQSMITPINPSHLPKKILNKPLDTVKSFITSIAATTIYIKKISFINNKFHTTLYDKDKSKILTLIKQYNKKIKVKSLKYDSKNKIYSMEVTIEY